MTTLFGVLILVCALFLIVSVLLQSSKNHRMSGVVSGGADTFFGKQKGKTIDAVLSKITAVISVVFCLLVLVLYIITARSANKANEVIDPIVLDDAAITTTLPEEEAAEDGANVTEEATGEVAEETTEEATEETANAEAEVEAEQTPAEEAEAETAEEAEVVTEPEEEAAPEEAADAE